MEPARSRSSKTVATLETSTNKSEAAIASVLGPSMRAPPYQQRRGVLHIKQEPTPPSGSVQSEPARPAKVKQECIDAPSQKAAPIMPLQASFQSQLPAEIANPPVVPKRKPAQARATTTRKPAAATAPSRRPSRAAVPRTATAGSKPPPQQASRAASSRNRNYRIPIPDPAGGTINIGEDLDYDFLMTRVYPYVSCFPAARKLVIYDKMLQLVYREYMREKRALDTATFAGPELP
ncbi:translation initiation factor IF-2-like [Anopheles merus]|uniref:translation initiation factor IF-2-like n=1 Tax=Anopheles merus TaxID=30066 RepID=UPI001BE444A9|nr:translation initiation factor IF-2-like [Anopheles merus]XP_041785081.1 translation initiation factor IF-2-like [Anopheles merus]